MKYFSIFILILFMTGCQNKDNNSNNTSFIDDEESINVNLVSSENKKAISFYIEEDNYNLSLYEPKEGIYLGAYILNSAYSENNIKKFEELTEKKHALYTYYTKIDSPFPEEWILTCISEMKIPNIIINRSNDKMPFRLDNIENIAKKYGEFYVPIFIHIYPEPHNQAYTPEEYINFYKYVREVFKKYASNVAFVWTLNEKDVLDSDMYYPGDEYVDWVGLDIFKDLNDDADSQKDIFNNLDYFYYKYQKRKPIMISQLGVAYFSTQNYNYKTLESKDEIKNIYQNISEYYPRIKAINYIDFNEIQGNNDKIKKNYSVTDNSVILDSYKSAISNNKYLSNIDFTTGDEVVKQLIKSPFLAYKIDNKTYFSEKSVTNHLEDLDLSKEKHININGENYFSIDIIKNSNIYSVLELSDKVIVKKGI